MASDLNPYEFLWIVKESAYGVPKGTPVAGTDSIYIRLSGANYSTLRNKPVRRKIATGGGFAAPGYQVSDQSALAGDLQVELCYSQCQLLLDWATTRINAGQTTPWVTTEPPGDLVSCSVYHGIMREDGTIKRRRYQGTKVVSWALPSSSETGTSLLKLSLRSQRMAASDPDGTAFPAPADTAFPTDPLLFRHLSGTYSIGGSVVAYPNSVAFAVTNTLHARYHATQYLAYDRFRGREVKVDSSLLYTASPDWRAAFDALTVKALSVAWTNGVNTVTLDAQGNNVLEDLSDDLTPGRVYDQNLSFTGQYDTATGNLITFAYA